MNELKDTLTFAPVTLINIGNLELDTNYKEENQKLVHVHDPEEDWWDVDN